MWQHADFENKIPTPEARPSPSLPMHARSHNMQWGIVLTDALVATLEAY